MKNICFITGRLVKDIVLPTNNNGPDGKPSNVMITLSYSEKDRDGNMREAEYYNIFCNEATARYLVNKGYRQGDTLNVTGKMRNVRKVDNATGNSTYHFSISIPNHPPYGIEPGAFKNDSYTRHEPANTGQFPPQGQYQQQPQYQQAPQQPPQNHQPVQQQMQMPPQQVPQQPSYPAQQAMQQPPQGAAGNFSDIRAQAGGQPPIMADEDIDID